MKPHSWRHSLVVVLVARMVVISVVLAAGFFVLGTWQRRELEKRIYDKARLFSLILGANLDKIVSDDLAAYASLGAAVRDLAATDDAVEEIRVLTPDGLILAASSGGGMWQSIEDTDRSIFGEVVAERASRSLLLSGRGREEISHFMPLPDPQDPSGGALAGVLHVRVLFPSQQGQRLAALRSNKTAFFKKEAAAFAQTLSVPLAAALLQVRRNFDYVQRLIENILADEEIEDIRIFVHRLNVLFSGASGWRPDFLTDAQDPSAAQAMRTQKLVVTAKDGGRRIEVTSPLFLQDTQGRPGVGGAVGIVLSTARVARLSAERGATVLGVGAAITAVFCLLIGLFFKRRVFKPVRELMALTRRIGQGDFTPSRCAASEDEMGQLCRSFNKMAEDLNRYQGAIEGFNERLRERIAEVTAELEEKQRRLISSEKLASLGVLSGGIAHEINNPLGIILGNAQILLKELREKGGLADPQETGRLLTAIEEYTRRCTHVVNSLLEFGRKQEFRRGPTDVAQAIERALAFTRSRLEKKAIEVVREGPADLPVIQADAIQMEQVFINIILNAEQSMGEAGRLTIRSAEAQREERRHVRFIFQDTGKGIPAQDLDKIFDPFFSTKEPGEGSGLGLSVSYGIIKMHGGSIDVASRVGEGTSVTVWLPADA